MSKRDPATGVSVATALGLVTLLAGARPARRAAWLDPMIALREDAQVKR